MKLKKITSFDNLFKAFFFISLYISFVIGELFFQSTNSPDYSIYSKYFNFFNGEIEFTNREQGLLYFFITYIVLSLRSTLVNIINVDLISHSSIQYSNFFLYIIGVYGMYKLLNLYNFKKSNIYISLTLINFFPVGLMLRWTFKPEILIFAFLPWVIYFLELFLKSKEIKLLYIISFPLVIIMTSKGPVIAMVGILMVYYLLKIIKLIGISKLTKPILFISTLFILLSFENFEANQRLFYDYQDLDPAIFNNPAELSILFNINFYDLFFSPFRHYHFDSLPGIILLDTYGDYFFWYFDNDKSLFGINSINLLENIPLLSKYSSSLYQSQLITLFYSIFSIFLLAVCIVRYRKYRRFLMLPLIGILILSLQALGFSSFLIDKNINFDKSTSDIFKMFYLGFFIIISFLFLYNLVLEKINLYLKIAVTILYIVSMLVVYGFPIQNSDEFTNYLEEKNNVSHLCRINSQIFNLSSENCNEPVYQLCLPNDRYLNTDYLMKKKESINSSTFIERNITFKNKSNINNVKTFDECLIAVGKVNNNPTKKYRLVNIPYLNVLYFLLSLFYFLFISKTQNRSVKKSNL